MAEKRVSQGKVRTKVAVGSARNELRLFFLGNLYQHNSTHAAAKLHVVTPRVIISRASKYD